MTVFSKALTKIEVATMLNVSPSTLRSWLNVRYFEELKTINYSPNQKLLTPKQLNFLAEKLDLTPE